MNRILFSDSFLNLLDSIQLQGLRIKGSYASGRNYSSATGDSQEFQDFRRYQPGDDLRKVDWNIFSRCRKLFLRRCRHFPEAKHLIVLDASESIRFSQSRAMTAWRLAALLGGQLLLGGDQVLLRCGADNKEVRFTPGTNAILNLCEHLSELYDGRTNTAVAQWKTRPHTTCWVISDFYCAETLSDLERQLHNAAFLPVRLLDEMELFPERFLNATLRDVENGHEVAVSTLALYQRNLRRMEDALHAVAARANGRMRQIACSEDVTELFAIYCGEFSEKE